jgi:protein O-mannosyl-transferase
MKLSLPIMKYLIVAAILILTFFCFRHTLDNQFTNWDDDYYVTNDPYIKSFTYENLKVIFTTDITKNNYHPLCMLSLAVNYHFAGLNPWSYYLTNVLIHMANVLLIFLLFTALCRRLKMTAMSEIFIASFGALWFGIHPMHVESVGWISERKDVLYAFFYIAGMLAYLRYLDSGKKKWYAITFLLFVASCLSKPMAVVFPLSLLCIDFLFERNAWKKLITEKVIFFLFSLLIGGMAFYTQSRTGAVASFGVLTIAERIMYASYGFVMYISKLFNPTYLSTFYPYPYRFITGELPTIYYAAPFLSLAVLFLPSWYLYKRNKKYFRFYVFGVGFFLANVIFVLQFISVGAAIMSDRYSYVAYIGLLFLVAWAINELVTAFPSFRTAVVIGLLLVSTGLAALCAERTKVWHNSETLLSDAIEKYPYRALLSYKWRGNYYFSIGHLDRALEDYGLLESINAADDKVKVNLEKVKALKALKEGGSMPQPVAPFAAQNGGAFGVHLDSCFVLLKTADTVAAFRQYLNALRVNPAETEKVMAARANDDVQGQQYVMAIREYNLLMKLNTSNPFYFFLRGCAFFGVNNMKAAIDDWEIASRMNSKDVQLSATYNLSVAYDSVGSSKRAYEYVLKAQELGYKVKPDFVEKLRMKSEKK